MNRLASAASPYLRQHADNPVDWFEWGEEAFAQAREEDQPIFLSVGYSSCHWCHVMAHESFEDPDVAALLNRHFVSVKVDREERPDVDAVYMNAVQALTGRGGWPMSVFLTPDGEPFFAGTYWPRDDRGGMPGFVRVLTSVAEVWKDQREQVTAAGERLSARLREVSSSPGRAGVVDETVVARAVDQIVAQWDRHDGGFGDAPKFPQAMTIDFLLAHSARTGHDEALQAATHSLTAMSRGGIYDHVAGGFARYATDRRWLIPHFEKMLYDNALLLRVYTHAAQLTGEPRYRRVAAETVEWLLSEMAHDEGGFACALDADSEGQEGKYYVWRPDEFAAAVERAGADPEVWMARFGVALRGNFDDPHGHIPSGTSILHEAESLPEDPDTMLVRARVREQLAAVRAARVRPGLDDKVLVSWNGLVIGALAEAGAALGEPAWIGAARRTAEFLADALLDVDDNGRPVLWHRWTPDQGAGIPAFAEDVAYLAQGLLALYEADHDPSWLRWAQELANDADARFRDPDNGTYFTVASDSEQLITRPRELLDNATPATSSVMIDVHLRLAALTGDQTHVDRAAQTMAALAGAVPQIPLAFGELLRAVERSLGTSTEVAIVGPDDDDRAALVAAYHATWRPSAVLAVGAPGQAAPVALLTDRPLRDDRPTAYVCHHFICEQPVTEPQALSAQLERVAADGPVA
jgi:uncharacterized protein YyaL (SSP411 family)